MTLAMAGLLFLATQSIAPAYAQEDLSKESQNPIGNLNSVPFENSTSFGNRPEDAVVNNFKPKP